MAMAIGKAADAVLDLWAAVQRVKEVQTDGHVRWLVEEAGFHLEDARRLLKQAELRREVQAKEEEARLKGK